LVNKNINIDELIRSTDLHSNLKILPSGTIPPNPSELLRQEKMGEMFQLLETYYDYLIIDSAPALLVTDTFIISQYIDLTLYIVRAGYTEKRLIQFAADAKESGSLPKLSFVLNNVELSNLGYGNKYGYGYNEQKKSFWKRSQSSIKPSSARTHRKLSEIL